MLELRRKLKKYGSLFFTIYMVLLGILASGGFYSGDRAYKIVFLLCIVLWLFKMAVTDFSLKEIIAIFAVFFLLGMTLITNGEKTMILTAMGITGAKDVDINKTLLAVLVSKVIVTVELGLLALTGFVSNTMHVNTKGEEVVSNPCLGFSHPNRAFLNFLMIAFLIVLVWKERIKWYGYLLMTLGLCLAYKVFYCRTGIITWFGFMAIYILYRLLKKHNAERIYLHLFSVIPIVLGIFTLIMVELGKRGYSIAIKMDRLLHDRLLNIVKYPVKGLNLFGSRNAHAFDNGLYHLLYNYGYIITILLLIAYIGTVILMIRQKKEYELLVLGAGIVVIFMEYAALSIIWNYSLVFLSLVLFREKDALWGGRNVSKSN